MLRTVYTYKQAHVLIEIHKSLYLKKFIDIFIVKVCSLWLDVGANISTN